MSRRTSLTAGVLSLALIGCSASAPSSSPGASRVDLPAATSGSGSPTEVAAVASAAPIAMCDESEGEGACQIVPGTANIFGAGHVEMPQPGGGGAGTMPPVWEIPNGATQMHVVNAIGTVKPVPASGRGHGAGGYRSGLPTDLASHGGISGIVNRENTMFLVGVFLTDEEPEDGQHPERLGFTDNEDFAELAPLIGQTFFIGDGVGRTYTIPSGATRLFVGFADGFDFQGKPGWYGNNSGQLAVTVSFRDE